MTIQKIDTVIKSIITNQIGRRVKLRLIGGDELDGTVAEVGNDVVCLSELSGRDYYDAVINLDAVCAVIVRGR